VTGKERESRRKGAQPPWWQWREDPWNRSHGKGPGKGGDPPPAPPSIFAPSERLWNDSKHHKVGGSLIDTALTVQVCMFSHLFSALVLLARCTCTVGVRPSLNPIARAGRTQSRGVWTNPSARASLLPSCQGLPWETFESQGLVGEPMVGRTVLHGACPSKETPLSM
jgi:hypothetical protein